MTTTPDFKTDGGILLRYLGKEKRAVIPDFVRRIENKAFFRCKSLSEVVIPESVTEIGEDAFCGCVNLKAVSLPRGVSRIGRYAFSNCDGLTEFRVDSQNLYFSATDGVLYSKDKTHLITYPMGRKDSRFQIPQGVKTVGCAAFAGCEDLCEIVIPNTVTEIGELAFLSCRSLTHVSLPESLTDIGVSIFYNCFSLKSVYIPDTVTVIERNAFSNCESLTRMILPESVESICRSAFSNCGNLTHLLIPDSVNNIAERVFKDCTSLKMIICSPHAESALEDCHKDKTVSSFFRKLNAGEATGKETDDWFDFISENRTPTVRIMKDNPVFCRIAIEKGWLNADNIDEILELTASIECRAMMIECKNKLTV